MQRPAGVGHDAVGVDGETLGEGDERGDAASDGAMVPVGPSAPRPALGAVGPQVLELLTHQVRLADGAVGRQ